MPHPPRIQFAGANYHVVTRGDGWRKLFHDTGETLAQLGPRFGLCGTDSVSNLVRRAQRRHDESTRQRQRAAEIEKTLRLKTEHKTCPRRQPPQPKRFDKPHKNTGEDKGEDKGSGLISIKES